MPASSVIVIDLNDQIAADTNGATSQIIGDSTTTPPFGSNDLTSAVSLGSLVYFTMNAGATTALYVYDGSHVQQLTSSSNYVETAVDANEMPNEGTLATYNGDVIFAQDTVANGTPNFNTTHLAIYNPATQAITNLSAPNGGNDPHAFTQLNGDLYFVGTDSSTKNNAIYEYDGTSVTEVSNAHDAGGGIAAFNGEIYFGSGNAVYALDVSTKTETLVSNLDSNNPNIEANNFIVYDNKLFALSPTAGVFSIDTSNNVSQFVGSIGAQGFQPVVYNGDLLYVSYHVSGANLVAALYSYNGTSSTLLKDNFQPSNFVVNNGVLYFDDGTPGAVGFYNGATFGDITLSGTATASFAPVVAAPFATPGSNWTAGAPTSPPVVTGASATFTGGGAAATLDAGLTVSDPSSSNLVSATIAFGSGFVSGDALNFSNQNGISGSYNSTTGVLTLTGSSSLASYQTALDSVTYSFTPGNGDPTAGGSHTTRTIDWTVNDGTSSSTQTTSTLHIVHAPPSVTAGATATYAGGGAAVALDATLAVSDADSNGNLQGATVTIASGFLSGDTLNFINQNGITGSYNATTHVLTLSGASSLANYQAALDSITYSFSPSNGDPTQGGADTTRIIQWVVNDGVASSPVATSTLHTLLPKPILSGLPGNATYPVQGAAITLAPAATVSEINGAFLSGMTISITGGKFANDGDVLAANTGGTTITATYDAATETLTLSGNASEAQYASVLDSVTFASTAVDPTNGGANLTRTVTWQATDVNGQASAAGNQTIAIFEVVSSGATTNNVPLYAGATETVLSGGTANGTLVVSGSTQVVSGGGLANATHIFSGGKQFVDSGGTASGGVVDSGGDQFVEAGGVASGGQVNGGVQMVYGAANSATINSGGYQYVESGGTTSGTIINNGGVVVLLAAASGALVNSGGSDDVYSGGVDTGATVNSGGVAFIESGGTATGATVNSGGLDYVFSGGVANGTRIKGNEVVEVGGAAFGAIVNGGVQLAYGTTSGTVVNSGGYEYAEAGGTATGTTVNSGGVEVVFGSATGTIDSGGVDYVYSGGVASGTKVGAGGIENVESGGLANGTTLNSGGDQYVEAGGTASGAIVNSGGAAVVFGNASGMTIDSGGADYVYSGGAASGTQVSGGVEFVETGGTASGTHAAQGAQAVYGAATGAVLASGGIQDVYAGGLASGTSIGSGGAEYVLSGAAFNGATISGGMLELAKGAINRGAAITFAAAAGGTLRLDDSVHFTGLVAGFGKPDLLDLSDVAFRTISSPFMLKTTVSFKEAANNTSGTLTVSDGAHTANLTLLGQYVSAQFSLASDGHGGTLVSDPPLVASNNQPIAANPFSHA
jgi:autotransporter passenger strand-loop-strand repeat protein